MRIKALKNFSGLVSMTQDEERDVRAEIADDLIKAGYAEKVEPSEPDAGEPPTPKTSAKNK